MEAEKFPRINRVVLSGFIQQDPELRFTPGGIPVASFRMRIARLLPENRGAKETVSYVTVVAWQDLAQKVSREGRNGQAILVEGFLHSRSFATTRGERRTVVEVYADSCQLSPVYLAPEADPAGSERAGSDRAGSDRIGQNRQGSDRAGHERTGHERGGHERTGYDRSGSGRQRQGPRGAQGNTPGRPEADGQGTRGDGRSRRPSRSGAGDDPLIPFGEASGSGGSPGAEESGPMAADAPMDDDRPPRLDGPRLDDPRLGDPRLDDPRLDDPRLDDPRLDDRRSDHPSGDHPSGDDSSRDDLSRDDLSRDDRRRRESDGPEGLPGTMH